MYWIKTQHPWLKTTHHTKTKDPTVKFLVWNPLKCLRLQTSYAHWCYSDKTDSISFILRKTEVWPHTKKTTTTTTAASYPLPHAFMEDTIRLNIAQMTSTSKAYVPCLLLIIIMMPHDHVKQASIPLWWSLRITWKTYDART